MVAAHRRLYGLIRATESRRGWRMAPVGVAHLLMDTRPYSNYGEQSGKLDEAARSLAPQTPPAHRHTLGTLSPRQTTFLHPLAAGSRRCRCRPARVSLGLRSDSSVLDRRRQSSS